MANSFLIIFPASKGRRLPNSILNEYPKVTGGFWEEFARLNIRVGVQPGASLRYADPPQNF